MDKVKLIKIKVFLVSFFILGIITIPSVSIAEMQIEVQENEIDVETIPYNPQPYKEVTVNLSSYATDLNKAIITWQGESGTVLSGIGKTSYTFTAPGPNSSTYFDISVTPVNSMSTINKRIVISPSEIEIMWESVSGYTPPFYRGKSLPTKGSTIKAVAIPNTDTIKSGSGSLSYTWKSDDKTVQEASGYNKNYYIFKNGLLDTTNEITVVASSVAGNYGAESTAEIPIYEPKLIFYKRSPTEGILYNGALYKEATETEDEIAIVAEPYFLSTKGNENNLSYSWKINGEDIETPSKKTELTLRPTSRGGYATIRLEIENIKELFQSISSNLKLNM